jgi:hypothetical protein
MEVRPLLPLASSWAELLEVNVPQKFERHIEMHHSLDPLRKHLQRH